MSLNGIAISSRGALAQAARIDVIARNIANMLTPGYRRETIGFDARLQAILRGGKENGQRVGEDGQWGGPDGLGLGMNGQQGGQDERVWGMDGQRNGWDDQGLGKNGQRVGVEEDVARAARRGDVLQENRVAPVLESAELIRALRALEANLQAIRIQDAVLERTVNEFARPVK
ncbi:MAG TPA: flagellar basal body protein [Planctomycetota bacterium]|nr:flagellar basal body protein [Planctomycetota bacterium]